MKKLYLNLMLLVCMMSMGINAWGQTTTLMEYGTSDVAWTADNLAEWTAGGNPTISEDGSYVSISGGNGGYSTSKTITPTENAIINVTVVWRGRSDTGRAFSAGNGSYFRYGNIFVAQNDQDKKHGYGFTGLDNISSVTTFTAGSYRVDIATLPFLLIEMEINTASKTLTSFTIKSEDGATTYVSQENVALSSVDFSTVAFGYKKGGSVSTTNTEQLKSVKITQTVQEVTTADYTINYVFEGNTVKSETGTNVIDATITAGQSIVVDGVKYIVEAEEAPSMTITEGTNVLNVPVRLPYTATLNVTTTINGESSTNTTNLTESDYHDVSWSYAYPLYKMGSDGLYYKADNTTTFGEGGTFVDGEVINKTATYTNADADVVFFSDASNTAGRNYAYSNGETGAVAAQNARDRGISVGTLPAGSYEFVVNITAANRRSLVIRQGTNDPLALVGTSNEDMTTGIKTAQFELTEETSNLFINGANSGDKKTNQSEDFDYVLIRKVASTVPVTISAAGYATFASDKALDLSNLPEGLTAYVATSLSSDAVTINPITTTVAPGTGLIFGGAAGDYEVPVASEGTEVTDNMLVGVVGEAVTLPQDGTCYVLALNAESKAVFQQVTTKAVASVPAGKAYLNTATASPAPARPDDMPGVDGVTLAKTLNIYLPGEGEATAIKTVETAEQQDGAIYNLAGQRVGKDYKGIVIMNGNKYLVK